MLKRALLSIAFALAVLSFLACGRPAQDYRIEVTVQDKNGFAIRPAGDCEDVMKFEPTGDPGVYESRRVWVTDIKAMRGQRVTFDYQRPCSFAKAHGEIILGEDRNPKATIHLEPVEVVEVRGIIRDQKGKPLQGAMVTANRPWNDQPYTVATEQDGTYKMPFKVADRQMIRITATYANLIWVEDVFGETYADFKLKPK